MSFGKGCQLERCGPGLEHPNERHLKEEAIPVANQTAVTKVGRCRLTPGGPQVDRARFQRLKLQYDNSVSDFAYNSKLRRYSPDNVAITIDGVLYVKIVDPMKARLASAPSYHWSR